MNNKFKSIIPCYYYILKVVCDNGKRTYYKIGNSMYKQRCEQLIKNYSFHGNNNVELIAFKELPHNNTHRLSDNAIRENLDKVIFKSVDQKTIEGCLHTTDGYTEFVECADNELDVAEYVADLVKSLSKSKYYTIDNIFDMVLDYSKDKVHQVNSNGLRILFNKFPCIYDRLYGNILNNILLIGQFDFDFIASIAMWHNVVLWHDSTEQKHTYTFDRINEHITYIDSLEELLEMCVHKRFDLVISNPPYKKVGAEITMNVIQNVKPEQFINLLPQNDYTRVEGLIQYVDLDSLERVENFFEDATVIPWVAKINTTPDQNMTEDDFKLVTYEKSLRKFYKENMSRSHYAIDTAQTQTTPTPKDNFNTKSDFFLSCRGHNGVSKTESAFDYKWNVLKSVELKDRHISLTNRGQELYDGGWIRFTTETEMNNFAVFWYKGKLMNLLLKGMNRDSGNYIEALPKVDWTRPWTDEEILKDFGYTEEEIKEVLK